MWSVRVAAPPADNAANRAVLALVSQTLGLAPSQVELVSGAKSNHKRLRVTGLSELEVEERLDRAVS